MGIPRCSSRGQTQSPGATRLTRKDHLGGFISVSRKGHFLDMVLELTLVDSGGPLTTSEMAKKPQGWGQCYFSWVFIIIIFSSLIQHDKGKRF